METILLISAAADFLVFSSLIYAAALFLTPGPSFPSLLGCPKTFKAEAGYSCHKIWKSILWLDEKNSKSKAFRFRTFVFTMR